MLRFVLIDCGTYCSFYFVAGKNPFEFRLLFRLQITCNLSHGRPAKWNLDKSNLYLQSLMLSLYRIYLNLDGLPKMQTQNFIRPAYLMVYHFLVFNYCLQCCASLFQTFLPQANSLFPQVEFVSFLMMILLKTDTKMHQRWNFFFKVKAGKNGACACLFVH